MCHTMIDYSSPGLATREKSPSSACRCSSTDSKVARAASASTPFSSSTSSGTWSNVRSCVRAERRCSPKRAVADCASKIAFFLRRRAGGGLRFNDLWVRSAGPANESFMLSN